MDEIKVGDWAVWLPISRPCRVIKIEGNVIWLSFGFRNGPEKGGVHQQFCRLATSLEKLLYT